MNERGGECEDFYHRKIEIKVEGRKEMEQPHAGRLENYQIRIKRRRLYRAFQDEETRKRFTRALKAFKCSDKQEVSTR